MSNENLKDWHKVDSYKKRFSAKGNQRIIPIIETVMLDEMEDRNASRDTAHLHPSDLAKTDWCPRSTYFKITDVKESNPSSVSLKRMNIFRTGHDIHDKWQEWMRRAGILWGDWKCESCGHKFTAQSPTTCPECGVADKFKYLEVSIYNRKHHIIGNTDGWIKDDQGDALVEIKSIGLGTIRWDAPGLYAGYESGEMKLDDLWKAIKRPFAPHLRQLYLYMYCLGLEKGIVIYEFKASQDVKEFHVTLDKDVVQPMLDGATSVLDSLEDKVAPPIPEGFMKSKQCRFCAYKDYCWNGGADNA